MSHQQRLREAIDAMSDAEADALLRWIEQRREAAQGSSPPDERAVTNADVIREDRDR